LRQRFYEGAAGHGIGEELAGRIYEKLVAFSNFGFPESHALSFALLVFASAWFKRYYPAVFCAALLKAQPMGFYSPQSLVADARRHGVRVRGPDVNASEVQADLEPDAGSEGGQAVRATRLSEVEHGTRVLVGGAVTHRQRPATAGGITFLNLEDETGMINVVCSPGLWARYRKVARSSSALLVRGVVERAEGVVNL